MTKFTTYALLIISLMVSSMDIFSQPTVKIGHYSGCSNTEILIPIEIENFEDVAALTINIGVDTSSIEYIGIENVNSIFSTGDFVSGINLNQQFISLNWASFTAANIEKGIMCNIRILQKKDTVNFNFQNNCEIVRSNLTIIQNVEYIDGTLVTLSSYSPNPDYQSVIEGGSATISLLNLSENTSCQWQINDNENWNIIIDTPPYEGALTSTLSIQSVSLDMNNSVYRCMLSNNICSVVSSVSELNVLPSSLNELNKQISQTINVYPNPVDDYLNCTFNSNIQSGVLRLINVNGKILKSKQLNNIVSEDNLSFNMTNINAGTYLLQLLQNNQIISSVKILRN